MYDRPEQIEVFRGQTINNGGTTYFGKEFALGEGWIGLHGIFNIALTIGSGSGAISEGELQIIKGITLKTDKGEILANNAPGRLLHYLSAIKQKVVPVKDAIAASTATYRVPFDIWFSDKRLGTKEKHTTVLDTSRYSQIQMIVNFGTIADLLTVPGSASIAVTLDMYYSRFKGKVPFKTLMYNTIGVFPPEDPTSQQYVDLERSANLAYKNLLVFASTGSTSGVPFSGTPSDAVISDMDLEATERFEIQNNLWQFLQRRGQAENGLTSIPAGWSFLSWVNGSRSNRTALPSGGQSRLKVAWRNGSLPSTPQVTVGYEGLRPLVGVTK
jgi:hypothetical protein